MHGAYNVGSMGWHEPRKATIVFVVAYAGALYQGLARTVQDRLRGCEIHVSEAHQQLPELDQDPRLVLIEAGCKEDIANVVTTCRASYPEAAIALLLGKSRHQIEQCDMLFAAGKVQGILPWTLKLEVWLAALSLLMSGGEYYPAKSRQDSESSSLSAVPLPQPAAQPKPAQPIAGRAASLPALTAREAQILELLAEGHQNKLIAHKLSLSEHTVKVHVHNLLSKLHVTNRTQAAAAYRRKVAAAISPAVPLAPDAMGAHVHPGS